MRRAHFQDGFSGREIARQFGISRDSVRKMLVFSEPPGYRRTAPIRRPKLDPFTEQIDQWLLEDKSRHRKQRHTAKRVFDRLKDECGFTGGYTIVKDYIREQKRSGQEMFVPLSHKPGHAQADSAFCDANCTRQSAGDYRRHRAEGIFLRIRSATQRRILYTSLSPS